jgi:hypothetical protein
LWHRCSAVRVPRPLKKVRPRISPRPDLTGARGTSARACHQFLCRHSGLAVVSGQFFLGEKLERAVPFRINGVPKAALNCRKHGDDLTTSWSSAALSTFSPIANFDIENPLWNHRCDYISTKQLTLLNYVSESGFRKFQTTAVVIMSRCSHSGGCSSPVEHSVPTD